MRTPEQFRRSIDMSYALFLGAASGSYQAMRASGVKMTPASIAAVMTDVAKQASAFMSLAVGAIDEYVAALAAETPEPGIESIRQRADAIKTSLSWSVAENMRQVSRSLKGAGGDFRALLGNAHGGVGALVQRSMGAADFMSSDTAGRSWRSQKLVSVIARDFAYQAQIDSALANAEFYGVDVEVRRPDGSVQATLTPADFQLARATLCHPNSNLQVTPHVQA